jgi:glycosyltransferase involved in cell wall biosynthesis
MLSPYSPYPPNSGGRMRMWEQIKYLNRRHDVTAVYYAFTEDEYEISKSMEECCAQAIAVRHPGRFSSSEVAGLRDFPWPVRIYRTAEMVKTLKGLQSSTFDAGIIEFIFMSHYRDLLPICTVLDEHNIESSLFRQYSELPDIAGEEIFGIKKGRAFWRATSIRMAEYENRMWPRFPLRATVSAHDKKEMERRCPDGKTILVENGINAQTINPVPNRKPAKILFMGTMDYYPNTDGAVYFCKSVMPFVWAKKPELKVCIAGLHPPESVLALATDHRIEIIANPVDMREIAGGCYLTIVPLRLGGGTRIKILDSMAMGLPVVSTTLGCEGLRVTDGEDLLIRDEPRSFAEAVLQVLSDNVLANTLRLNGRRLVEEHYDWGLIFIQLEQELFHLVEESGVGCLKGNGGRSD